MGKLYDLYLKDPVLALDHMFEESHDRCPWVSSRIFVWSSAMGIDKDCRYGTYKYLERKDLENRKYDIEYFDGKCGIFFTDVLFDPRTKTHIQKE